MWCMGLKVSMGHEDCRYYKHTKFRQNLRGDPTIPVRNDPMIKENNGTRYELSETYTLDVRCFT